ncbi:MAG: DegT/DnrJ/EryC1/StrS family aminotransferase [Chitinophagaceae bacterium]
MKSTWNMDVSKIEEKITSKTKAILVVHIYGLPVDMDPILRFMQKIQFIFNRRCCRNAWTNLQWKTMWKFWRYQHF